jgi:hypothetical protein
VGRGRWASFIYERVTISYIASLEINAALGMGEPVNLDDEVSKGQENRNQQKRIFLFITASPRKSLGSSGTIANALEGDTYRSRHAMVCASSSPKKRDVETRLDYFGARRVLTRSRF